MKYNYHTHVNMTRHAFGSVEEYVLKAIEKGYEVIGFSDHVPSLIGRRNRMTIQDFYLRYLKEINEAKRKYGHLIKIYAGLEVEYEPEYLTFHKLLRSKLDYLILGQHEMKIDGIMRNCYKDVTPEFIENYVKFIEEALDTKLYSILAHPELFRVGNGYKWGEVEIRAAERLIKACIKNNVYMEMNANGLRYHYNEESNDEVEKYAYPYIPFWKIVKEKGAKVIISDDCHTPKHLCDSKTNRVEEIAKSLDINYLNIKI